MEHLLYLGRKYMEGHNIGMAIPIGVVAFDLDAEEVFLYAHREEECPIQASRDTGRRGHGFFAYGDRVKQVDIEILGLPVTVRGAGLGQCVVWPSVHEYGDEYHWMRELPDHPSELPNVPAPWADQLQLASAGSSGPAYKRLLQKFEVVPPGQRHAFATSVAGALRNMGLSDEALEGALWQMVERFCQRPEEKREAVTQIARDYSKKSSTAEEEAQYQRILRGVGREPTQEEEEEDRADDLSARFQGVSLGELGFLRSRPLPRRWVIPDLIPEAVAGLLAGPGGIGKGFLIQELALSVATGKPFGPYEVPTPRGVLYVSFEDDLEELHRRVYAVASGAGISEDELQAAESRIGFVDLVGLDSPPSMEALVEPLRSAYQRLESPGLIVIDPLAKILGSGIELNRQEHGAALIRASEQVARETGGAAVMVHHVRKGGGGDEAHQDEISGTHSLVDLSRFVLMLKAITKKDREDLLLDEEDEIVRLSQVKANYAPAMRGPMLFQRGDSGVLSYVHVDQEELQRERERRQDAVRAENSERERAKGEANRSAVLEVARGLGDEDGWWTRLELVAVVEANYGFSEATVRRALQLFVSEGTIEASGSTNQRRFRVA